MRQLLIIALGSCCILLDACGDMPFVTPPTATYAIVRVHWMIPAEIRAQCGQTAAACTSATIYGQTSIADMYAEKPSGFRDTPRVEALGHELLHALGATHE